MKFKIPIILVLLTVSQIASAVIPNDFITCYNKNALPVIEVDYYTMGGRAEISIDNIVFFGTTRDASHKKVNLENNDRYVLEITFLKNGKGLLKLKQWDSSYINFIMDKSYSLRCRTRLYPQTPVFFE